MLLAIIQVQKNASEHRIYRTEHVTAEGRTEGSNRQILGVPSKTQDKVGGWMKEISYEGKE